MEKIMYGLKLKSEQELIKYSEKNNGDADCCNETTVEISKYGDKDWLVDSYEMALYVKHNSTPWYNSCIETPMHSFGYNELEIVKVVISTSVVKGKDVFEVKPINIKNGIKVVCEEISKIKHGKIKDYTNTWSTRETKNNLFIVEDYDDTFYRVLSSDLYPVDKFLYIYKKDWKKV